MAQLLSEAEIQNLLQELQNPSSKRREATVKSLARLGIPNARILDPLQNLANNDPVIYVREAAISALRALGQTPSIQAEQKLKQEKSTGRKAEILGAILALITCSAITGIYQLITKSVITGGLIQLVYFVLVLGLSYWVFRVSRNYFSRK